MRFARSLMALVLCAQLSIVPPASAGDPELTPSPFDESHAERLNRIIDTQRQIIDLHVKTRRYQTALACILLLGGGIASVATYVRGHDDGVRAGFMHGFRTASTMQSVLNDLDNNGSELNAEIVRSLFTTLNSGHKEVAEHLANKGAEESLRVRRDYVNTQLKLLAKVLQSVPTEEGLTLSQYIERSALPAKVIADLTEKEGLPDGKEIWKFENFNQPTPERAVDVLAPEGYEAERKALFENANKQEV